jgi:hypothetical protein
MPETKFALSDVALNGGVQPAVQVASNGGAEAPTRLSTTFSRRAISAGSPVMNGSAPTFRSAFSRFTQVRHP